MMVQFFDVHEIYLSLTFPRLWRVNMPERKDNINGEYEGHIHHEFKSFAFLSSTKILQQANMSPWKSARREALLFWLSDAQDRAECFACPFQFFELTTTFPILLFCGLFCLLCRVAAEDKSNFRKVLMEYHGRRHNASLPTCSHKTFKNIGRDSCKVRIRQLYFDLTPHADFYVLQVSVRNAVRNVDHLNETFGRFYWNSSRFTKQELIFNYYLTWNSMALGENISAFIVLISFIATFTHFTLFHLFDVGPGQNHVKFTSTFCFWWNSVATLFHLSPSIFAAISDHNLIWLNAFYSFTGRVFVTAPSFFIGSMLSLIQLWER